MANAPYLQREAAKRFLGVIAARAGDPVTTARFNCGTA
jgi:hypothetical protein